MNEIRETATAARYPAIPHVAGDIAPFDYAQGRLRQGGRFSSFSQKFCTLCNIFVKKKKRTMLPQANRASIGQNVRFACPPRKSCQ
jgi:hypothetical protein